MLSNHHAIAFGRIAAVARRAFTAAARAAILAGIGATALPAAAGGCGNTDTDFDGLTYYEEYTWYGTDYDNPDTDYDGVSDGLEIYYGSDPLVADYSAYPDRGVQQLLDSRPAARG